MRTRILLVVAVVSLASCNSQGGQPPTSAGSPHPSSIPTPATSPTPAGLPDYVAASVKGGEAPVTAHPGFGYLWVTNHRGPSLFRIDPETMKSKEAEYISGGMIDLAITPHGVWTLDWINERLVEIDPKSLKITAEIPVGVEGGALTYGDGSLWLATGKGSGKGLLFQVDPETSEVVNKYEFPDSGLLGHAQAGDGLLWIGEDSSDKLMRVDPLTGKFLHELHMSEPVSEIRYEAGALWAIGTKGTLYRLDPQTGKVQSQITVGDTGAGLAVSGQQIAVRLDDTSIAMVDPRTESVTNTYDGLPTAEIAGGGLDFAYGSLWATNWTDATIWRFN